MKTYLLTRRQMECRALSHSAIFLDLQLRISSARLGTVLGRRTAPFLLLLDTDESVVLRLLLLAQLGMDE